DPGNGAFETIADQDELGAHRLEPPSSDGRSCWTRLLGMAKPTPTLPSTGLSIDCVMPITWPWAFTSAPPELPGLIAVSVWIRLLRLLPTDDDCVIDDPLRLTPETIPSVSVPERPNGDPIASTLAPTWTVPESPRVTG